MVPISSPPSAFGPSTRPRQQRGDHHFLDGRAGQHAHGLAVLGLAGAFHDAGDLAELAAHFFHHRAGRTAHGFHRHRAEQVRDQAADEEADDHHRVAQVEADVQPEALELVRVVGKEHQRGEAGRADGVALGHGLGGVADRVERIGHGAHAVGQLAHLGDAAGVVGDGAVGVERDHDAGHAQH
jgi:hypothetical protein